MEGLEKARVRRLSALPVRKIFFWMHLIAGLAAGLVIMIMCVTGVILAFEPQIVEFAERKVRFVEPPANGEKKDLGALLAQVQTRHEGKTPRMIILKSDPKSSVVFSFGKEGAVFVDPYSGEVLGSGSKVHEIMHVVEDWHRWIGSREIGRPLTGAGNLIFLFLAVSGLYLWWPKDFTPARLKGILLFNSKLKGKPRDWNWHNVIGFWSLPYLIVITVTGAVMSYTWANNLLYTLTGNEAPPPRERPAEGKPEGPKAGKKDETAAKDQTPALDLLYSRAAEMFPGWISMTMRMPEKPGAPVSINIEEELPPHPKPRSQLTLDSQTAEIKKIEPFKEQNLGRKLRLWFRYLHTGEAAGVIGQLIAGLASAGGAVLVWTGFALAWRRFFPRKNSSLR